MIGKKDIDVLLDCAENDVENLASNFDVHRLILILEHIRELYSSFQIAHWWVDDQKAKLQKIIDDNQEVCRENGFECQYVTKVKTGAPMTCKSVYLIDMDF